MTRGPTLTLDAWAGSSCRFSAVGSAVSGVKTPEPTNHGSASVQQPKAPAMGACSHAPLSSQRVSGDLQRCILGDRSVCSDVGAVIHAAICHRVHEDGSAGTGSAGHRGTEGVPLRLGSLQVPRTAGMCCLPNL